MVNAGAAINEANEQEMFELIDSLDDMTCLVISGSLPPNTSEGFLAEVLRRVKAKAPSSFSTSRAISLPTLLPWSRC